MSCPWVSPCPGTGRAVQMQNQKLALSSQSLWPQHLQPVFSSCIDECLRSGHLSFPKVRFNNYFFSYVLSFFFFFFALQLHPHLLVSPASCSSDQCHPVQLSPGASLRPAAGQRLRGGGRGALRVQRWLRAAGRPQHRVPHHARRAGTVERFCAHLCG